MAVAILAYYAATLPSARIAYAADVAVAYVPLPH